MRRRAFLSATACCLGVAGCLSRTESTPGGGTADPQTATASATTREHSAGVTTAFRIVDGHRPTEASAAARFDAGRVVVTGTMDPAGCREPILDAVEWRRKAGRIRLVVGTASPYGPTASVECGNASYDYRCTVSVESGAPRVVEVVHAHANREDQTFVLRDG